MTTTALLPDERRLRRLLSSDKPEDAAALQSLLDSAPDAVGSRLVYIAKDAQNGRKQLGASLFRAGRTYLLWLGIWYTLLAWFSEAINPDALTILLLLGAAFLGGVAVALAEAAHHARASNRAPVRAARLLAARNDVRVVGILARFWTPAPLTAREAVLNADVGRELSRLLSERQGERYDLGVETALYGLVERTFPTGTLARVRHRLRPRPDLTEADTDLLLEVVRHLSHPHPAPATLPQPRADENALRRVAAAAAIGPNYDLLRDTTQVLLRAGTGPQTP